MATVLEQIKAIVKSEFKVEIKPLTQSQRRDNIQRNSHTIYNIEIITDFTKWSMFPSGYFTTYHKAIEQMLQNHYGNEDWGIGTVHEQGPLLSLEVFYSKGRTQLLQEQRDRLDRVFKHRDSDKFKYAEKYGYHDWAGFVPMIEDDSVSFEKFKLIIDAQREMDRLGI